MALFLHRDGAPPRSGVRPVSQLECQQMRLGLVSGILEFVPENMFIVMGHCKWYCIQITVTLNSKAMVWVPLHERGQNVTRKTVASA